MVISPTGPFAYMSFHLHETLLTGHFTCNGTLCLLDSSPTIWTFRLQGQIGTILTTQKRLLFPTKSRKP